jgi:hypothetical protein
MWFDNCGSSRGSPQTKRVKLDHRDEMEMILNEKLKHTLCFAIALSSLGTTVMESMVLEEKM